MTTVEIIGTATSIILTAFAVVGYQEGRNRRWKEDIEQRMDLKIGQAITKLKEERLNELLAENIALKDKNERLRDAVKSLK